ncbi:ATP-dependent RecD-like DNA helicase [Planktothrix sp. FACHB-1355]|uniref:ATP-dependent RecD2 DNA helicase n=1 Tax=Aerosakkonema funiforme FACHB-1375 TaxID=2949571 RepID=A0A926VC26_9CYAN|nr:MULTISPECIES: ATP-dependent RecD-like DNA helicase [Oscillatoriales]MBD2181048.1 ATP-dependent RecD-like DNA helicase [Aerosakkonema funiforme FACHB-1375]MBD3558699.1 ATP-dependent RecD-like DNA helicase [Planktothrix sp. FACHB-1355]
MSGFSDNSISTSTHNEFLTGVVERLTFHSEESGYTVARLKAPNARDLITIVGNFANIQPGQTLRLSGIWKEHPNYGSQFQVTSYLETKPATLTGLEKYLGSGLIKGVGPVTAKRIVAHFGLETLDIIENQIQRLAEVSGIAKKRIAMIQTAWQAQKAIKEVMVFLQSHGVSTTYAVKIFKQYGEAAIDTVTNNPYQLATDIYGIGFITADKIARQLGMPPDSPSRYRAGIVHILGEAAEDGHCFLPLPQLIDTAIKQLTVDNHQPSEGNLDEIIKQMKTSGELLVEEFTENKHPPLCYKPAFFKSEQHLAQMVKERLANPINVDLDRVKNWIERFTQAKQIQLSQQQYDAVVMSSYSRVTILTGGPGCGKTFCTHTIVALWKAMGKKIALAAPTGRAAQRLSEMTGIEAKTIHRLLEFDPRTHNFKRGLDYLLDVDAIVIDEASMLDLFLAHSLLKAIPENAQLLLVGDVDQLPSVGPGQVLRDLIDSDQLPVVRLTQVFRQAAQSGIIKAAHSINKGNYPVLESVSLTPQSDCLWIGAPSAEYGVQAICELIKDVIPQLGYNPATDVQVLSPMTKGVVGIRNLNKVLQELINPPSADKAEVTRGGTMRVRDRVIQQVNDYDRGVFNGDLGTIVEIDNEEMEVTVQYNGRDVVYDLADLNEIALAWATTIHKSQGSEYPVVLIPLYTQHYLMLTRNLLYTGLTRAKKLAVLVGPKKAIALSVRQVQDTQRYTRLRERLTRV